MNTVSARKIFLNEQCQDSINQKKMTILLFGRIKLTVDQPYQPKWLLDFLNRSVGGKEMVHPAGNLLPFAAFLTDIGG